MTNLSSSQTTDLLDNLRMKLLVIEDETKLAEYLQKGLGEEGFVVDAAHNGIDGLHLATEQPYDLIILDGMLPGIDGLAVLAALRQSRQTPVLMLTARAQVEDRVKGCRPAPMTIWSSLLHFQSWWPAFMHCCAAACRLRPRPKPRCCAWPIWSWICCVTAPRVRASGWT
jgi:CheY-like chemotaxis protein